MPRNINIGLLAYNEAAIIDNTLRSLLQQSLFKDPDPNVRMNIIVVPNGCTDETAEIARSTLKLSLPASDDASIQWKVCEVEQPGLANAWNLYIHEFSDAEADYLFVMSADIELLDPQTFSSMVEVLERYPDAQVSVDKRIKDVVLKEKKSWREQLSVLVSGLSGSHPMEEGPAWISGQLYCARTEVLRRIWMPTTLPTDDAFLYTMITTDGLKSSPNPNQVILAKSASHAFEAYTDISRLFRHEKWLIFGQTINELLYEYLRVNREEQENICSLIQQQNEADPFWLNQLVEKAIKEKGGWLIPQFIVTRRFQSLKYKPIHKAILLFPLAVMAFGVDFWLAFQVNQELNKKGGLKNWVASGSWGK